MKILKNKNVLSPIQKLKDINFKQTKSEEKFINP